MLNAHRTFLRVLLCTLALAFASASTGAAAPAVGDPYTIDTILPLTGSGAYSGQLHAEAMRMYETFANANGGIRGRPVHFDIHDDQSNPVITVQLTNQALAKNPAIIMGSAYVAACAAEQPLVLNRSTVEFCVSPGLLTKQKNVFATSIAITYIVPAIYKFMRDRGFSRVAVIVATDATGQASDTLTQSAFALPENKNLQLVANEHFNPTDITVSAQIARVKAANPQGIVIFATGNAFATVLRGLNDSGIRVPVVTSAVNMNHTQLEGYTGFLPPEVIFNSARFYARAQVKNPALRTAIDEFYNAYKAQGLTPSPESSLSWDPAKIVVAALRALGPTATGEQISDYISNLHDFAGVSGIYDFRNADHHGLTDADLVWVKWQPAEKGYVVVTRPNGTPM
jgi:branched-chain amino acid transport system substrate-binding protein